jgi:hypothetical protein
MRTHGLLATLSATLLTSFVAAQPAQPDRVVPLNIMWQNHPPTSVVPADPLFVSMVGVQIHVPTQFPDPVNAANHVASRILAGLANGTLHEDGISVLLAGFGHDWFQSQPGWSGTSFLPPTSFWVHATDSLPGMTSFQFPDPPPINDPLGQRLDARPWRHPFPINATQAAPLKEWMEDFVDRIEAIHASDPNLPDPALWRFYFDTEPFIYFVGERNGVYIPNFLASQANDTNSIWNTWPVPGSEGWQPPTTFPLPPGEPRHGKTLAELYAEARAKYGWPTNPEVAFNASQRADHSSNRPHMIWWMSIWHRAADAVMKNCAYDVLEAAWPGVRYGNYDSARYDGKIDTTSWFDDPDPAVFVPRNTLPRVFIERAPGGSGLPPLTRHNASSGGIFESVWAGVTDWSSGTACSPELYRLNDAQFRGYIDGEPVPGLHGHRLPNWYRGPGGVDEALDDTTLRLDRHTVESIINSDGGKASRLAPWTAQFSGSELVDDPIAYYQEETPQRRLIAMLRGKNVSEIIHWTATTGTNDAQRHAWEHTASLMRRLYAASVIDVQVILGAYLGVIVPEPAMLEYTLRTPQGEDYTLDIIATGFSNQTIMQVKLDGLHPSTLPPIPEANLCGSPGGPPGQPPTYAFEVLFEVAESWHLGSVSVQAYRYPQSPSEQGYFAWVGAAHVSYTPDGSLRGIVTVPSSAFVNSQGVMVLRFVCNGNGMGAVSSRFDLVQVIPVYACPSALSGDPIDPSDVDASGESNIDDISLFLNAYSEGEPLADLTMDGVIDADDVQTFLDAYTNASP